MKFAKKLAIALWIGITLIYVVNGVDRIRREAALFESDMQRDHAVMGRGLVAAVGEVWESAGPAAALDIVERANLREGDILIRWVDVAATGGAHAPAAPPEILAGVASGARATWEDRGWLYTYVPVQVNGAWTGAVELSESLATKRAYLRASMIRVTMMTGALALVSGGIAMALGAWFVGRPIRRLAEKARRVGAGDFGGELVLAQDDELGQLAGEMNAMSARLAEARARLDAETAARIAAIEQLRHGERVMTVGKLASGVAHELGTPLNVIAHRTKLVATRRAEGDAAAENARIAHEQCERITRIVRQLLDYARRGRAHLETQDVAPLVDRALELLEPLARRQKVEVVREPPPGELRASVDASQIQQVVTNLAMNAIQAMPDGGRLVVRLDRVERDPPPDVPAAPAWVRVAVDDTGHGIAPEHLPLVFDPFFTTKDVGEGTGLGLSVAWGIVREHGGFIEAESSPGRGSTFTVCLPVVA
ncbi:MAG: sensor histidine kinase [Myxococcota bacterium]